MAFTNEIARDLEQGATPPDPDRTLATEAPAPFESSYIWKRAVKRGGIARKGARSKAAFETTDLQGDAANAAQRAAERLPLLERRHHRDERLQGQQAYFDEYLRPLEYRDTSRSENRRYYGSQVVLALAEVANITNGGIQLGDHPVLAFIQGCGVGVAGVSMGMVGSELRARRKRAERPQSVPENGEQFGHWYGKDGGAKHSNLAIALAGVGLGFVFTAQYALRASLDGSLVGLVYGAFAAALVVGSFFNSYFHGALDEATAYRLTLTDQIDANNQELRELEEPEAGAAELEARIAAIKEGYEALGETLADEAEAEAYTIAIAYPNLFGTHAEPVRIVGGVEEPDDGEEDKDAASAPSSVAARNGATP